LSFLVGGSYDHEEFYNHFDGLRISANFCRSGAKIVYMGPYLLPYHHVRNEAEKLTNEHRTFLGVGPVTKTASACLPANSTPAVLVPA
jgi:hypothetical protein